MSRLVNEQSEAGHNRRYHRPLNFRSHIKFNKVNGCRLRSSTSVGATERTRLFYSFFILSSLECSRPVYTSSFFYFQLQGKKVIQATSAMYSRILPFAKNRCCTIFANIPGICTVRVDYNSIFRILSGIVLLRRQS